VETRRGFGRAFRPEEERMTTEDKVKEIIARQLCIDEDEVTPGADLRDDLGADSLDVIELVMQVEESFDFEIPDEDAENVRTVKDILDYVTARVK
jgi:acyl carrier protein